MTDRALDALNEQYLRRRLRSLGVDGAISLWTLPDFPSDVKPPIEYPILVMVALYAAPTKKLQLQEIYDAIMERYPFFRTAPSWQVRRILPYGVNFCEYVNDARRSLFDTFYPLRSSFATSTAPSACKAAVVIGI